MQTKLKTAVLILASALLVLTVFYVVSVASRGGPL